MQALNILAGSAVMVLILTVALHFAAADDIIMQKREVDSSELEDRMADPKRKRPFCNAFTGCGRKRSDESMGTLVELNSEPAVEELSRQILSEAKLWEAIQEARAELQRRRHQQQQQVYLNRIPDRPLPLTLTGYRKKRSAEKSAGSAPGQAQAHINNRPDLDSLSQ